MSTKLAFMFVASGVDKDKHQTVFAFGDVSLYVVGVANYAEAAAKTVELVSLGVSGIELCAGFGNEGVALIQKTAGKGVLVGAVRFDLHPAFGHRSGDELFC